MAQDRRRPAISVVIPIMNEAANIEALAAEVSVALDTTGEEWECLWVDDGSTDATPAILAELCKARPRHRYIAFAANAGQSAALWAGFREATGEVLATLDGDGQNDPADVPALLAKIRDEGWDMVNGYRERRHDNLLRKIASRVGNGFRNWVTGRTVRDVGCSTRAFRRECVADLPNFKGMHRFLPTFVSMAGFRITEVPVNHRSRKAGESKYTTMNRLWVGLADTCGVRWLRGRRFSFLIEKRSDETN